MELHLNQKKAIEFLTRGSRHVRNTNTFISFLLHAMTTLSERVESETIQKDYDALKVHWEIIIHTKWNQMRKLSITMIT